MSLLQTTLHILHNLIDSFDTPHSTTLRLFDSRSSVVESAPLFLALLVHGFSCGPIKGAFPSSFQEVELELCGRSKRNQAGICYETAL